MYAFLASMGRLCCRRAWELDRIVAPVGVPTIFASWLTVFEATGASSRNVWKEHPESMMASSLGVGGYKVSERGAELTVSMLLILLFKLYS